MATNTISVHTLSFAQDFSEDKLKRLTGPLDQNSYGVWHGKCIEDPDLDIVVIGTLEITLAFTIDYNNPALQLAFPIVWTSPHCPTLHHNGTHTAKCH